MNGRKVAAALLAAYGQISANGGLSTRSTSPQGAEGGPGVDMNAAGITLYDGTTTDHGFGPGVAANLDATSGNASFSGTIAASILQGPPTTGTGRMTLDLTGNTPGASPLLDVVDASNVSRVQVGYTGDSYVGYGVLVQDDSFNRIFDSMGVSQVMKTIANTGGWSPTGLAYNTNWTAVAASQASFSLPRTTTVMVVAVGSFYASGGTANYMLTSLGLTSLGGGYGGQVFQTNGLGVAGLSNTAVFSLSAGSYTASVYYSMQGGATTTANFVGGWTFVFQMGG